MDQTYESQQLKGIGYEVFILLITLLAIANLLLMWFTPNIERDQVIFLMNFVISLVLLLDFGYRLISSPSKKYYLINDFGWLDLLGSLPIVGIQVLRLFRVVRVIRLLREIGTGIVSREFLDQRAKSTMATVAFLVILVLQFGSYFVVGAEEGSPNANITTSFDAIWWTFVTITTVGFGDEYPVTNLGRVIGIFVIITGVILFSVLTGFISTRFQTTHKINNGSSESPGENELAIIRDLLEAQAQSLHNLETQISQMQAQLNKQERE